MPITSTVVLTEYHQTDSPNHNGTYVASSYLFTFALASSIPPPESIDKSAKVEWRHRHSGTSALERKWWRHRRTEVITMKGKILNAPDETGGATRRLELEALATRNSLWKITINCSSTGTTNLQLASPALASNQEGSAVPSTIDTAAYYIITDSSFSLSPGKMIVDYSLTFERVML